MERELEGLVEAARRDDRDGEAWRELARAFLRRGRKSEAAMRLGGLLATSVGGEVRVAAYLKALRELEFSIGDPCFQVPGGLRALEADRRGRWLAVVGHRQVEVLALHTWAPVCRVEVDVPVLGVRFLPEGEDLRIVCLEEGSYRIQDVEASTGKLREPQRVSGRGRALDISPDGNCLAQVSLSGGGLEEELELIVLPGGGRLDVSLGEAGKKMRILRGGSLSPKRDRILLSVLAETGADRLEPMLHMLDLARGFVVRELPIHQMAPIGSPGELRRPVAWSPDGTRLARMFSAARLGPARLELRDAERLDLLWDLAIPQYPIRENRAWRLDFPEVRWLDGARLAAVSGHEVLVVRAEDGRVESTIDGEVERVRMVAPVPGQGGLAVADRQGFEVVGLEQRGLLAGPCTHRRPIRTLAASKDRRRIATLDEGGEIRGWDAETGDCLWTTHWDLLGGQSAAVPEGRTGLSLSADGGRVLALAGSVIYVLDGETGETAPGSPRRGLRAPSSRWDAAAMHPDGDRLLAVAEVGSPYLMGLDGSRLAEASWTHGANFCGFLGGGEVAVVGNPARVHFHAGDDLAEVSRWLSRDEVAVSQILEVPGKREMLMLLSPGVVRRFPWPGDEGDPSPFHQCLEGVHFELVRLSPDGVHLVGTPPSGSRPIGRLDLWDLTRGERIESDPGTGSPIRRLLFSPCGRLVLTPQAAHLRLVEFQALAAR